MACFHDIVPPLGFCLPKWEHRMSTPRVALHRQRVHLLPLGLLLGACVSCGCASWAELESILIPTPERFSPAEVERHQRQFQIENDPAALNWLLCHQIENGMSIATVNEVIGSEGLREFDDAEMKRNGGHYQQTDVGYKWGPDRKGRSVVLFFRDGKLINFDPDEFRQ